MNFNNKYDFINYLMKIKTFYFEKAESQFKINDTLFINFINTIIDNTDTWDLKDIPCLYIHTLKILTELKIELIERSIKNESESKK